MSEPLAPLPGGLALAAFYQPTIDGLTLYTRRTAGAVSDLATALYGPTASVGHRSDRKPPRGHMVACYVAASAKGPALPVLVPDPDYIKPGPKPGLPGSQRTARLVVRVTPSELSAYQAAAGRAGVSMGEWVRAELADVISDGPRVSESDEP